MRLGGSGGGLPQGGGGVGCPEGAGTGEVAGPPLPGPVPPEASTAQGTSVTSPTSCTTLLPSTCTATEAPAWEAPSKTRRWWTPALAWPIWNSPVAMVRAEGPAALSSITRAEELG